MPLEPVTYGASVTVGQLDRWRAKYDDSDPGLAAFLAFEVARRRVLVFEDHGRAADGGTVWRVGPADAARLFTSRLAGVRILYLLAKLGPVGAPTAALVGGDVRNPREAVNRAIRDALRELRLHAPDLAAELHRGKKIRARRSLYQPLVGSPRIVFDGTRLERESP